MYYSRHRRSTAFCEKCAETLDELKSAGLTAAELERLAGAAGPGREKLAELAGCSPLMRHFEGGHGPSDRVLSAAEVLEPGF